MMRFSLIVFLVVLNQALGRYDKPPQPDERPPIILPQFVASSLQDYKQAEEESGDVFFVDESLDQVLKLLGELTERKIIAPESLPNPVFNFDSQGKITKKEAIVAIESLLSLNGIAIAEMGDQFLRVIPSGNIKNKSPDMLNQSLATLEPSEKMYSKLYKVNYMKWEDVTQLVNNRLSPNGAAVELYESTRSFIVTDTLVNLQRVERLLKDLDVSSKKIVLVRKLSHILASELKTTLEDSLTSSLAGFVSGTVSIQSDERTNQLVITTNEENVKILDDLIKSYDVDTEPLTSSKVVYIKHAESATVVSLLESIISSQKSPETGLKNIQPHVAQPPSVDELQESNKTISSEGRLQFSPYLSLVADERSNAIVIYGTQKDILSVTNLISDIDVLLAQVKIDVVIAEVTLTDENSRGLESFGISYDENDETHFQINEGSNTGWSLEGSLEDIILSSWTVTGFTMATVFDTAKRDSNVNVLSAPTLVTTHNREAVINAGESRPIITSTNTDSTGLNTRSQVQYKDIGIKLKVKPLIGSNGVVQMEIEQVVESVVDEVLIDGNSQPVIGSREATSFVSVRSGEMIILGGLQEKAIRNVKGKMAFLGDIPIFGNLFFSSDRNTNTRRELVIFIRPTVYFSEKESSEDLKRSIRNNSESMNELLKDYLDDERIDASPKTTNDSFENDSNLIDSNKLLREIRSRKRM